MPATKQELDAINANTAAINRILDEAESINDHPDLAPFDNSVNILVQKTTGEVLKTTLSSVITNSVSSGIERFDATVGGTNAQYTTLKDAYDAGKRTILYVSTAIETADLNLNDLVYIYIPFGVTAIFGQYNIVANVNTTFIKEGDGDISYAYVNPYSNFFDQSTTTSSIKISGGRIIDLSTSNNVHVSNASCQIYTDLSLELSNNNNTGIKVDSNDCYANNIEFRGGGANCWMVLEKESGDFNNIKFSGIFSTLESNLVCEVKTEEIDNNFHFRCNDGVYASFRGSDTKYGQVKGITTNSNKVNVFLNRITASNIDLNFGELNIENAYINVHQAKRVIIATSSNTTCVSLSDVSDYFFKDDLIEGSDINLTNFKYVYDLDPVNLKIKSNNTRFLNFIAYQSVQNVTSEMLNLGSFNVFNTCFHYEIKINGDIANPLIAPPTEVSGDVYYLDPNAVGTVNASWDGAAIGDTVEFNGSIWEVIPTPTNNNLISCYTSNGSIQDNGINTNEIATNSFN